MRPWLLLEWHGWVSSSCTITLGLAGKSSLVVGTLSASQGGLHRAAPASVTAWASGWSSEDVRKSLPSGKGLPSGEAVISTPLALAWFLLCRELPF